MKINENIQVGESNITFKDLACNIITGQSVKAGYKVDGKEVYVKRIGLGTLNAGEKIIAHGLTNFIPIKFEGIAYSANLENILTLPFPTPYQNQVDYDIQVSLTATTIYILCYNDNSDKVGYLDIYYVNK